MGYRQILIEKANKLSLEDNQLCIKKDDVINKVPLEDINFIILEDRKTILTASLLSEISKYYISLIICNEFHEPATLTYAYNQHYKQLEVLNYQLEDNHEIHKLLWQNIIKFKITNQLLLLEQINTDQKAIDLLKEYSQSIELDDSTNREGLAAKVYFRSIYGSEFIRFYDDATNAALNYGYSILKSAITRALVAKGLITYLGIHHKSKTNNFNLVYDLIESYRPLIDKFVYENKQILTYPLSFDIRAKIIDLLNSNILIDSKKYSVQFSIDIMIDSYIKSITNKKNFLKLPISIIDEYD